MSLKIDEGLYSQLINKGFSETKKKGTPFAPLIVQLYGSVYLSWLITKVPLDKNFKLILIETRCRYKEIQDCLKTGSKLQGKFFDIWLKSQDAFFTISTPGELIEIEKKNSYSVLTFPFQETFFRIEKHAKRIEYFENIQIKGTELLYKFLEAKAKNLSNSDLFCLHRVLFTHFACYEKKKWIAWHSLLLEWAHSKDRLQLLEKLFPLFGKSLPDYKTIPFEKQEKSVQNLSCKEFVIQKTIQSLEEIKGFSFTDFSKQTLCEFFEEEKKRLDCLFFLANHSEELEKLPSSTRFSRSALEVFKMFKKLLLNYEVEKDDLPYFLECLFRTDFSIEHLYKRFFSTAPPKTETHEVLEWIAKQKLEQNNLYLPFYLTKFPGQFLKIKEYSLSFPYLSATQIVEYLSQLGEDRLRLTFEKNEIAELKDLLDLPLDTHRYLFPLWEENGFTSRLMFLKKVRTLIDKPLENTFVFTFLISRVDFSQELHTIFEKLNSLPSIEKTEERESEISEVCNFLGRFYNTPDNFTIPSQISYLLLEKFGSVKPENED